MLKNHLKTLIIDEMRVFLTQRKKNTVLPYP